MRAKVGDDLYYAFVRVNGFAKAKPAVAIRTLPLRVKNLVAV